MKIIVLLLVVFFEFFNLAAQSVNSVIKEVTVYRQNAKLSHIASANVIAGTNEVVVGGIAGEILESSLQVGVKGNATLLSATFRRNYTNEMHRSEKVMKLQDSLKKCDSELKTNEDQMIVFKGEENLLNVNNKLGSQQQSFTVPELKMLADFYRNRCIEVKQQMQTISKQSENLVQKKYRLQNQINELNGQERKSEGEIVLSLAANISSKVNIQISYVVASAAWYPIYDLRCKGTDKPLNLTYKANVQQSTGFDWKDVKLSISTGNPSANNNKPELYPQYVDFYVYRQVAYKYDAMKKSADAPEKLLKVGAANSVSISDDELTQDKPSYVVTETEKQILAEYTIELLQNIPSDNKDHLVGIKEYELPASYKYQCVPKLSDGVFLLAIITDYGKYNLLTGQANIFFDDMYVGQSEINPNTSSDTLLVSLGRDDKIVVKRTELNDLTSKKIIGTNTTEVRAYEILVRNNKNTPINIEVLDQLPISRNSDIVVEILENSAARYTEIYGKLLWNLNIAPAQSSKLKLMFSVKYPKDRMITGY